MKILILGAGKMGSFFTDLLSFEHEVAVLESDPKRMRFIYNALRLQKPEEVAEFKPELVINCVTLSYTIEAFKSVMPYLQPYCIISDIASVKNFTRHVTFRMFLPIRCSARHLPTWDNWKKKIRSSSPKGIIWERFSSKTSIRVYVCISVNIHSRNTTRLWLTRWESRSLPRWCSPPR